MPIKSNAPKDPESFASETESDTYLADQVLQRTEDEANQEKDRVVDFGDELLAMRAEVDKIAESIGLLADSAKALISDGPALLENEFSSFIQRRPLIALFGTTGLSFIFTLRLLGSGKRRSY